MNELSLVQFSMLNFWNILITSRPFQPISTILIKLIEALIYSEPDPDLINHERIKWIYKNTHEKINIPISIVELAVFKNLDKGLNREIEIWGKTFLLTELYMILDEISLELASMSIQISKKYSLDIPYLPQTNKQTINFND